MTGWLQCTLTTAMIGLVGGVSGWLMDGDLEFALVCGAGALVSGAITSGLFGRSGQKGWMFAVLGAFVSTGLGAFCVGAVLAGVEGGFMASAIVFVGLVMQWSTALVWVMGMTAAHIVSKQCRPVPT